MNDFVHLHLHSQYSVLDGAIRLGDMMPRLKEHGMTSVAVTDHGNMFGAVDFYKKAQKYGIKPILGVEAYVAEGDRRDKTRSAFHLILLARNDTGYANLRKLVSFAYLEGFYYHPRIDLGLLRQHSEGLIGLSACLGGQIAQAVLKGRPDHARELARTYRDIFEPGCFFLEVQPNGIPEQKVVNELYRQIGKELDIPLAVTNDCHYLDQKDAKAHEILMCVQTGKTLDDPTRMRHDTDAFWLRPGREMWRLMGSEFGDALENTVRIAEMCNVKLDLGNVYLPAYRVPDDMSIDEFLVKKSQDGLVERFQEFADVGKSVDRAEYQRRLDDELGVIQKMGFAGYFLIVKDFIDYARSKDIRVGPGRGSAAGSMVAYVTGITNIDPLEYGLLFERFLNPERVSMPDIDIDFEDKHRTEVIEYVRDKYGHDCVAQIVTFGRLKTKAVLKDVGRVLGLTYAETDRITKMVPDRIPGVKEITLTACREHVPELRALLESDSRLAELWQHAEVLEGLNRATGVHPAGVVITPGALDQFVPLQKVKGPKGQEDVVTTQWDGQWIDAVGLLKMDFLGLRTLTVIKDAQRHLKKRGIDFDIEQLPKDDRKTYELFGRGDTVGVFQFESSGMQEHLKRLQPERLDDLIAMNALYRPGPMDNIPTYIERRHGREEIKYLHPILAQYLEVTYGIIVYQEQVMQIGQAVGGFSLGQADEMRRAMGKKDELKMTRMKVVFSAGAAAQGIDGKVTQQIWDLLYKFANYGFNKSHSAAYAWLAYQTGYLKANHTAEFMAGRGLQGPLRLL
jgi:DNA polymerase-3 subunit alpha